MLRQTLALAREKSAFYRQHLARAPESLTELEDLARFPFTTPQDIRQNPLWFVCVSQDEIQRVVTLRSSGTTGKPKRIYFTADDQELTIDFFRVGMSTLVTPGERVMILLPGEKEGSVGDLLRIALERLGAQPFPLGPAHGPQVTLENMQHFQTDCLVGSPTQVLALALHWQPFQPKPHSVLLSTDHVPAAIVRTLERVWGCEVYNHYGSTEMGLGGGVECMAHGGYHLREADLYFEVVDPLTGEPVEVGEYGEVVFTTLTRRGMPLIRYRTGDRSRFVHGNCPCGTWLKTLEQVRGRIGGAVTLGEETLALRDLDEALFSVPGLLNFWAAVSGDGKRDCLTVEVQMLHGRQPDGNVARALQAVPAIQRSRGKGRLDLNIHYRADTQESVSLLKRVIADYRGTQNA